MGSSQYAQRGPQIEPLLCRESPFRPAEHWVESIRDLEGSCLGIFTLVPEPYRKLGLRNHMIGEMLAYQLCQNRTRIRARFAVLQRYFYFVIHLRSELKTASPSLSISPSTVNHAQSPLDLLHISNAFRRCLSECARTAQKPSTAARLQCTAAMLTRLFLSRLVTNAVGVNW